MQYKIDLHVHTNHSMDGVSSLEALICAAKSRGLNGFAVTDHNLCTDIKSYQEEDFLLIPGCEISTTRGHIVGVFLDRPIPVKEIWQGKLPTIEQSVEQIHAHGGIAILAHPHEKLGKIYTDEEINLVDCIEVCNARAAFKNKNANSMAKDLASKYAKHQSAGSDAHSNKEIGNAYVKVEAEHLDLQSIKEAMMSNNMIPVLEKNTAHYRKGRSQFAKAMRSKNLMKIAKSIAYVGYCIYLDCVKR